MINRLQLSATLAAFSLCAFASSGCDKKTSDSATATLELGKPALYFNYEAVTELTLAKNDPETSDHWTTKLQALSPDPESHWQIVSAPEGRELTDRLADGGFIRHLLDTLRSLRPIAHAPTGSLSSMGLEPPRFFLSWKTRTPEQNFEVQLGNSPAATQVSAALALFPLLKKEPVLAQGSTLQMLSHIKNFESLRLRRVFTWTTDDIETLEIKRGKQQRLFAQRQSGGWADRKGKSYGKSFEDWLERLMHLQIARFMDESTDEKVESQKLGASLSGSNTFQIFLKSRQNDNQILTFAPSISATHKGVPVTHSGRPGAVFILYSDAIKILQPPATFRVN